MYVYFGSDISCRIGTWGGVSVESAATPFWFVPATLATTRVRWLELRGAHSVYLAVVEKIAPGGRRWQADELRLRISAPHSLAFTSVLVETFTSSSSFFFLTRSNKVRDHNFCKSCNLDFLGNIWISFGDLSWPFTGHWIGHRSLVWTGEVKMLWERPGSGSDSIKFSCLPSTVFKDFRKFYDTVIELFN